MNMVCTSGKCACANNYVFNRPNNICIFGEILPRQNLFITKCKHNVLVRVLQKIYSKLGFALEKNQHADSYRFPPVNCIVNV